MLPDDIARIERFKTGQPNIRQALEKAGVLPTLSNIHFTKQLQEHGVTLADIIRALNDDPNEANRYILRGLLIPHHLAEISLARTPFSSSLLHFLPEFMRYEVVSYDPVRLPHLKNFWYPGVRIADLCVMTGKRPSRYYRIWVRGKIELAEVPEP